MLDQVIKLSVGKTSQDLKPDFKSETKNTDQVEHYLDAAITSEEGILKAVVEEGIFEAARLSNPILPQYHPQQLIKMLNSGKTKRVKAILLHVLRALKVSFGRQCPNFPIPAATSDNEEPAFKVCLCLSFQFIVSAQ